MGKARIPGHSRGTSGRPRPMPAFRTAGRPFRATTGRATTATKLDDLLLLPRAEAEYWDLNDRTRAFGNTFFERMKRMPTMSQAATDSATLHCLKAVEAAGSRDTKPVLAKMREAPVRDAFTDNGVLREDSRMVHAMLLFVVKKPEGSKGPWDYYKVLAEVPGDQGFRPLKDGNCPHVKP
jgi:branched-chain amino acid transport system substrate-binding protein